MLLWSLRHEGLGNLELDPVTNLPVCASCQTPGARYRCADCLFSSVVCQECMCKEHARLPLHRIGRWNDDFFAHTTLRQLGLVVCLGHGGARCPLAEVRDVIMTIVDISGVHTVAVSYCGCQNRPLDDTLAPSQLLDIGWWPSTFVMPRTAVTAETCKLFQAFNQRGKLTAHDFWNGLVALTDGAGLRKVPARYAETTRVFRFYRHIRAARRGGRAHEDDGIAGTKVGELALPCIACPHWYNLPANWKKVDENKRFLYSLPVSLDANFKMRRKNRDLHEDALSDGFSYTVKTSTFLDHLSKFNDTAEMKYCKSTHQAVNNANQSGDARFDINGIGACVCARHNLYRAQCIVDLFQGERHNVMDHCLLSSIEYNGDSDLITFIFTYDIACQWSVNFHRRLRKYARCAFLSGKEVQVRFAIPKMHIKGHGPDCNEAYSLNYLPGVGRLHAEGIEAGWADLNGAALSTREMSKAARHEAIDDLLSAINWRKTIGMGTYLLDGLEDTVYEHVKQQVIFDRFEKTFPAGVVMTWRAIYDKWVIDPTAENPFHAVEDGKAYANAQYEVAKEEAEDLDKGNVFEHAMTPSVFVTEGISLEDQRYFREAQRCYMKAFVLAQQSAKDAAAASTLAASSSTTTTPASQTTPYPSIERMDITQPEIAKLWLPSGLPADIRADTCSKRLCTTELRLRLGQLDSLIHHIRRLLNVKASLLREKNIHADGHGNRVSSRARTMVANVQDKLNRHVHRYRISRAAALALDPQGDWVSNFLPLTDKDLVPPTREESDTGVGFRKLAWIWYAHSRDQRDVPVTNKTATADMTEEEIHEGMRLEWAEGRARVLHWAEEKELRPEEMRRSVTSLLYNASKWDERKGKRTKGLTLSTSRALDAYAARQAAINEGIARGFYELWEPGCKRLNVHVEWPEELSRNSRRRVDDAVSVAALRTVRGTQQATAEADAEVGDDNQEDILAGTCPYYL
ncbi:hypothetical protein PENSPDRAFT_581762 [Peniophora sp. CONT]|nr:hypothetical protein PENSPDRAFT_581762 [Peniophora sp. CONT]